jgi:REP element-mobilizing transposase RayT
VCNKFRELKRRPYWGNRFWVRGYCVDMVGLDELKIHAYVQYRAIRVKIVAYCHTNLPRKRGGSTNSWIHHMT